MKIAFVGDSITAFGRWSTAIDFADVEVIAIPGASTDATITAIPEIVASKPDVISLLIGTNDFGNPEINRSASEAAQQVLTIVTQIRRSAPGTKVILHSILPRGLEESGVDLRERVIEANKLIAAGLPDGVQWVDLWSALVAEDGLTLADQFVLPEEPILKLHLNEEGYKVWESILIPTLRELANP